MQKDHTTQSHGQSNGARTSFEIWLFNHRLTKEQVAKAIKVAPAYLSRYTLSPDSDNFQRCPLNLRLKIRKLTDGAIKLDDWPEQKSQPQKSHLPPQSAPSVVSGAADTSTPSGAIRAASDGAFSNGVMA